MSLAITAALAALAGCTGGTGEFTVPEYQNGLLVDGHCPEEVMGTDMVALTAVLTQVSDWMDFSELGPGPGKILHDQAEVDQLFEQVGSATTFILPFPGVQGIAVWYQQPGACVLEVDEEEVHIRTDLDGTPILDVQFYDSSLNCGQPCTGDLRALVFRYINDPGTDAKVCRRVRPGCPPPG